MDFMADQYVPGLDPEEDARRMMLQAAPRASALPRATGRAKKQSVAGTLTTSRQPGDGVPTDAAGRADYFTNKGLEAYAAEPDVSGLQNYARQRSQEGSDAMLMALAAGQAGKTFAPVQEVYLKRAMAAQDPLKVGNAGYITPTGDYVKDPTYAQDRQAEKFLTMGQLYSSQAQRSQDAQDRLQTMLAIQGMKSAGGDDVGDARRYRGEDGMRTQFERLTSDLRTELGATRKITELLAAVPPGQTLDPVSQQSVVILLNKFLDPGSVVREGEFDRVVKMQGLEAQARNLSARILKGDILDASTLQQINTLAQFYQRAASAKMSGLAQQYGSIARRRGYDVNSVISDPALLAPMPAAPAAGAPQTYNGLPVINLPSPRR